MPRKPSIGFWPTRKGGGYFCIVKGERHELALGPDDHPEGEKGLHVELAISIPPIPDLRE
ncbi:MAG: hypothetical protein JWO38_4793 [Gemmataceae bacterium]|nr:hypothetical protein [Gemmataceae bacterium]